LIRAAVARVKLRAYHLHCRHAVRQPGFDDRRAWKISLRGERAERLRRRRGRRAIRGNEHAHIGAQRAQRGGQCRGHIGKPPGLGERGAFGRDEQNA